jgi:hypothetical protein
MPLGTSCTWRACAAAHLPTCSPAHLLASSPPPPTATTGQIDNAKDLDDEIDDILERFRQQTTSTVAHSVCFY